MVRFLNSIFSLLLLILLLPLFLIISIAIKVDSEGPVFFKQRRIGKNNREFLIYKFRTMKINTPDLATDKLQNPESHITRIGKFLRKSSLDEIPQLINILKGEMAFIGPRPALYNQYKLIKLRKDAGVYTLVPGVTGWAQINGRDNNNDVQKTQLDKYYLENKSLSLNLRILFMTLLRVLKCDGIVEGVPVPKNKINKEKNKEGASTQY